MATPSRPLSGAPRTLRALRPALPLAGLCALALSLPPAAAAAGAGSCSSEYPASVPTQTWPAAQAELVPAGATAATLCEYKHGFTLEKSLTLSAARRKTLISDLDAVHNAGGSFTGNYFGGLPTSYVLRLAYPGGRSLQVEIQPFGKNAASGPEATNGAKTVHSTDGLTPIEQMVAGWFSH